jgi:hypothetical protein
MIKAECLDCGQTNSHFGGCDTSNARYQIVFGGCIQDYAHVELGLYKTLVQIREDRGTLSGVKVYDYDKKLTRQQLGEIAIKCLNA